MIRNVARFMSILARVVLVMSLKIILDFTCKQLIFILISIYAIYCILEIVFNCKLYLFKCYRRKMMLLRNKNQRLFNKVHDEDLKIVRARFTRTKSYKLYTITVSLSRYLPCKFFMDVRKIDFNFFLNFNLFNLKLQDFSQIYVLQVLG